MNKRGILFILSGPSGVGKGEMRKLAVSKLDRVKFSISCTTREPRDNEIDGVHYHFITPDDFQKKLSEGKFLEHATVHGHMYGTLRSDVERELDAGNDVILEIDVQGALQVRKIMDCVTVFVLPPSREELAERLRRRGTESDEKVLTRLKNAEDEMRLAGEYDHIIVNDDLSRAAVEFKSLIESKRRLCSPHSII